MNAVLTAYFVVLGTLALTATVLPAVEAALPRGARQRVAFAANGLRVPLLMKVSRASVSQLPGLPRCRGGMTAHGRQA